MTNQISTISFNNQSLITFEQDGTHYTAMKPICENIGLAWNAQLLRIKRDEILSQGMIVMIIPSNGGEQQMVCLPIEYLNGWLFGIDVKRVRPEIRETLIKYKKECYQALHNYWFNGKAERSQNVQPNLPLAPQPERTFTRTFNEQFVFQLGWLWYGHGRMGDLLGKLEPALRAIGSHYAPTVHSHSIEYRRQYQILKPFIAELLADYDIDTFNRHGLNVVLKELDKGIRPQLTRN